MTSTVASSWLTKLQDTEIQTPENQRYYYGVSFTRPTGQRYCLNDCSKMSISLTFVYLFKRLLVYFGGTNSVIIPNELFFCFLLF